MPCSGVKSDKLLEKQCVGCVQLMRMQYLALFTPEHGIGGRQIPFYFISNLMNKGS
jgi:hypothetical protein